MSQCNHFRTYTGDGVSISWHEEPVDCPHCLRAKIERLRGAIQEYLDGNIEPRVAGGAKVNNLAKAARDNRMS